MFVYLAIVQSPYLTQRVNPARTDFDFGPAEDAEAEMPSLFEQEEIRRSEIRDACIQHIYDDLAEIIQSLNAAKEERIWNYIQAEAPQYKILMRYVDEFIEKVPPLPSRVDIDTVLHRELYQREVKLKAEGSKIIKEAEKVDNYEEYQARLGSFPGELQRYRRLSTGPVRCAS